MSNKDSVKVGNKTGAWLVRYALEQLPVKYTFGIPGVHNTEIYDELNKSDQIEPLLVTHESGAGFISEAISRTSQYIGTLLIVPAAGVTHAMSAIGEAFLDGIPLLVISGGIRTDVDKSFQLHELNQRKLVQAVTKKAYLIEKYEDIVPSIFEAYSIATSGLPGPVLIEIPVNLQLFKGTPKVLPSFQPSEKPKVDLEAVKKAVDLLTASKRPGLFLGWGAKEASDESVKIAEKIQACVATTLQGLSVFPGNHPLHTSMGFGAYSTPAGENAFKDCDALLAVGTRFAEIPTGSFGVNVPENLVHVDIDKNVFNKNYKAKVTIEGDALLVLTAILNELEARNVQAEKNIQLIEQIAKDKKAYKDEWAKHINERVNPSLFFDALRKSINDDAMMVVDDGNHTFLAAELFTVLKSKHFISPTDFNCMGYAVPAAIGTKLVNPDKQVVSIIGDGAFIMTCMEILTATANNLGIVYFVFYDGELSQISQGQEIPYNRKTCTVLGNIKLQGVADATGAAYVELASNEQIDSAIASALKIAEKGQPVIVDVKVDYSKRTRFTNGVVKTVLSRFPLGDKVRFIGRALYRKITG